MKLTPTVFLPLDNEDVSTAFHDAGLHHQKTYLEVVLQTTSDLQISHGDPELFSKVEKCVEQQIGHKSPDILLLHDFLHSGQEDYSGYRESRRPYSEDEIKTLLFAGYHAARLLPNTAIACYGVARPGVTYPAYSNVNIGLERINRAGDLLERSNIEVNATNIGIRNAGHIPAAEYARVIQTMGWQSRYANYQQIPFTGVFVSSEKAVDLLCAQGQAMHDIACLGFGYIPHQSHDRAITTEYARALAAGYGMVEG